MEEFSQLKAQEQDLQRQLHSLQSSDHVLFQELGASHSTAQSLTHRPGKVLEHNVSVSMPTANSVP